MGYEIIDHTADVGIRVTESTMEEAFSTAAKAMFELIVAGDVRTQVRKDLDVEAPDHERLLVAFLSELLYFFDVEHYVVKEAKVNISGDEKGFFLSAKLGGDTVDFERHEILTEIKAVTYHMLSVEDGNLQVLFDI
ncbi:MAG: archease [Candidatus Thermoplasmatota archaeon]|nr:archease [Candidatus Thermoplasmatota archaeon]